VCVVKKAGSAYNTGKSNIAATQSNQSMHTMAASNPSHQSHHMTTPSMANFAPNPLAASQGARPLPAGWQEFMSDQGQTYYYNAQTGVTQWERP